jgi:hypothetical protein
MLKDGATLTGGQVIAERRGPASLRVMLAEALPKAEVSDACDSSFCCGLLVMHHWLRWRNRCNEIW